MSIATDLKNLGEEMASGYTHRKQETDRRGRDILRFLKDAAKARVAQHARLMADLGAAAEARTQEVAELKSATHSLLDGYARAHKECAKAWQGLVKRMHAARGRLMEEPSTK